ncbi:hypothetical protein BO996_00200 [Delftia sp. HK171]|uniref:methyltransferase domain-containing protein n=1 Tax=Delftia sp. HK171 TaxID=1920191 RepID=UPI000903FD90|nr:methyltransferase domain-containing protein [Delftia sp. HK171]APE46387.1 hypothetical protein BO996_00200 [Delftia sp. HK171]
MSNTTNCGRLAADRQAEEFAQLLTGMRGAYLRGENAMEYARLALGRTDNLAAATLIAYDLQAGSYIRHALSDPQAKNRWTGQLARLLAPHLDTDSCVLEVGVGEATTLAGVLDQLRHLNIHPAKAMGLDISWSRCAHGRQWLERKGQSAKLFVADLFRIPLADDSVDVIYTSHSLEPNGGREAEAISELLRVARKSVVLVEPIHELADAEAQQRMRHHGYVRNLRSVALELGFEIEDYRLLDFCANALNPSGVITIRKTRAPGRARLAWRCPITHAPLNASATAFSSIQTGLVYPVLDGIPLLCKDHAVLASAYGMPLDP